MMDAAQAWRVCVWSVVGRSDWPWHERSEFSSIESIISHAELTTFVVTNHPHCCRVVLELLMRKS